MANTKIKLDSSLSPKEKLDFLLSDCSNNNQICIHLKRHTDVLEFLESKILPKNKKTPMELLYLYTEGGEVPLCICGDERKYRCKGYRPTCGKKECIKYVRENSKMEFCLKNYGVNFVTQLESMKEKSKITHIKKYGVDNITKSKLAINRRGEKNLKKWGVKNPISLKSVRGDEKSRGLSKIQKNLPLGYKVVNKIKASVYELVCPKGHIFETFIGTIRTRMGQGHEICNLCNEYVGSMVEQEVFNYISSIYSGKVSRSNRKLIKPFEIDIVLEDIGICIEFNGDYWHSTKVNDDPDYHWTKSQRCLDVGYKLLQIKENDWYMRNEWVKSNLLDVINNTPISINENIHILDLSWYDDRFKSSGNWELVGMNEPKLIKVGETIQWDSGQEIYRKL